MVAPTSMRVLHTVHLNRIQAQEIKMANHTWYAAVVDTHDGRTISVRKTVEEVLTCQLAGINPRVTPIPAAICGDSRMISDFVARATCMRMT